MSSLLNIFTANLTFFFQIFNEVEYLISYFMIKLNIK